VECDLVVIGAGPAGLAGAAAAAGAGLSVVVVDFADRPGGQYFRHRSVHPTVARLLTDVRFLAGHRVFAISAGFVVHTQVRQVHADAVLIATGAYDRQVPFPGWDLPGVFAAGGAQALVKGHGVLPGQRIVVAGTGPFLLPVAAGLASAGATVVGVFEANDPARFVRFPACWLVIPASWLRPLAISLCWLGIGFRCVPGIAWSRRMVATSCLR